MRFGRLACLLAVYSSSSSTSNLVLASSSSRGNLFRSVAKRSTVLAATSSLSSTRSSSSTTTTGAAFIGISKSSPATAFINRQKNIANIKNKVLTRSMSSSETMTTSMADSVRVGLLQFHVTDCKATNHKTAIEYITKAHNQGAQIVVLPEIWNSPYATAAFPEYAETVPEIGYQFDTSKKDMYSSSTLLLEYATKYKLWIVGGSIPEKKDDKIYNTCLVINPEGTIVAKHSKVHLFDINVPGKISFFESETLTGGDTLTLFDTDNFGSIGIGICYDIRFPEYAMLLNQKALNSKKILSMLIYPGAFNLTTGPAHWELLQRARAVDNQCYVMMASPARSEEPSDQEKKKYPHYTAWGHSTIIGPWGDIIATTDENEAIVMADLDLTRVQEVRDSIPILKQKRTDMYKLSEQEEK